MNKKREPIEIFSFPKSSREKIKLQVIECKKVHKPRLNTP